MASVGFTSIDDVPDNSTVAPHRTPSGTPTVTFQIMNPVGPATGGSYSEMPSNLEPVILSREGSRDDSVSPKGAIGRHQVMPATAVPYLFPGMPNDKAAQERARQFLFDPKINAQVGHQYIQHLWDKYHDPIAVMIAYNAGPHRADEWLATGKDPKSIPEETQKYIGVGPSGTPGAPGWVPSSAAIDTENRKSNTSVKYMDPLQYLSLLPPLENDDSTKTKKENLKKSLSSGDNIEDIPSLEVEPKGDDLKIIDHDGRNRAQAAIDAGVDSIPVAINGDSGDKEYKNIVGKKKLPYSEFKAVPPASALQEAQKIVPQAFAQGGVGAQQEQNRAQALAQPQAPSGPVTSSFDPALAAATAQSPVPTKPDYYPQIVAGVNNDIYNPRGIGYRGTGVPDLATNATAGERIAAANKNSAGQVGLPASSPASSMMGMLSNLNPIGSAQAAESSGPVGFKSISDIPSGPAGFSSISDIPSPPHGIIPHVPGLDIIAPPLANALMSLPVNAAAAGTAGIAELGRMLAGQRPSIADYNQTRNQIVNKLTIPETPIGQTLASVISAPGAVITGTARAFGWAAEKILGLTENPVDTAAPYLGIASDLALPFTMFAGPIRNALAGPSRSIINRVAQTPAMVATKDINKSVPDEIRRGMMPIPEVRKEIGEAQKQKIPLTIADFVTRGGPMGQLLGHALENSPEATAAATSFLEERTEGTSARSSLSPAGGTLERMTNQVKKHFGDGSAFDTNARLDKALKDNYDAAKKVRDDTKVYNSDLKKAQTKLKETDNAIANHVKIITPDTELANLKKQRTQDNNAIKDINTKISKNDQKLNNLSAQAKIHVDNRDALKLGQSIFKDSTRVDKIRDFIKKATPEQLAHFRIGMSDEIRNEYGKVTKLGREPYKVVVPENVRQKIAESFIGPRGGNRIAADNFIDTVKAEAQVSQHTDALLKEINKEGYISQRNATMLRRVGEALAHIGVSAFHGIGLGHVLFWAVRGGRQLTDYLNATGGQTRNAVRQEISNSLLNTAPKFDPTGKRLLEMPARSPVSTSRINALANASVPAIASSVASSTQPAAPLQ